MIKLTIFVQQLLYRQEGYFDKPFKTLVWRAHQVLFTQNCIKNMKTAQAA